MPKIPTIGATDPCIILMGTVVSCPAQVVTEGQGRFISITSYFIQENVTWPCTKSSTAICRLSSSVAKLTTDYIGSFLVPAMIAHCSPQTLILNFYSSTRTRLTTHEPNIWRESSESSKQFELNMVVNPLRLTVPAVTDCDKHCPLFCFKKSKDVVKIQRKKHVKSKLLKSYWCFMFDAAILESFLLLKVLQNSKVLFY